MGVLREGTGGVTRYRVARVGEHGAKQQGVEHLWFEEEGAKLVVGHVLGGPTGDVNMPPQSVGVRRASSEQNSRE